MTDTLHFHGGHRHLAHGGDSLLLLLRLLLGLLGVGDDEVNGIFGLLQQNSQFCLDLLRPGTEGRVICYSCLSFQRSPSAVLQTQEEFTTPISCQRPLIRIIVLKCSILSANQDFSSSSGTTLKVFLTVSANFNNSQKEATNRAKHIS